MLYSNFHKHVAYEDRAESIKPSQEDLACELQLQVIGDWVATDFVIDPQKYLNNVKIFEQNNWFRPFQPKKDITNDRHSVLLYGLEGDEPTSLTGLSHIEAKLGYKPKESDFKYPTKAAKELTCMSEVFDYFDMGRCFFIRMNAGAFYPPHRDHFYLKRPTFRLIAFLGNTNTHGLHWEVSEQKYIPLPNHVYYVDTRKMHRLNASYHKCDMVVMNVKKDWVNINRLLSHLKYKGG